MAAMGMRERRNRTKYSQYLVSDTVTNEPGGSPKIQKIYKFPNGFGASIIQGKWTYGGPEGQWEIGVIKYNKKGDDWNLTYNTPITDDVIGHLSWEEVLKTLKQIKELKK